MTQVQRKTLIVVTLFLATCSFLPDAQAHRIRNSIVTVTFNTDSTYRIEIRTNMEAVLTGIGPQHGDTQDASNAKAYDALRALPPAELKKRILAFENDFLSGITVEFDGTRVTPRVGTVDIPDVGDLSRARISTLHLVGDIPVRAQVFTWSYSARFGNNVLKLRNADDPQSISSWLKNGEKSKPFRLSEKIVPKSRGNVAREYLALGFTHILPKGLDHILFVMGIFLLTTRLGPLLWQVSAFTLAHSITLGMTIYGVFSLSPSIVEPLIALSIVYVGLENVFTRELKPWRVFVVFLFGLLHGMGFAGVLSEIGLPRSEFLTGLVSFNVGVELGQLTIISLAFLAVGWFKNKSWFRSGIIIPASAAISLIGLNWTIERAFL